MKIMLYCQHVLGIGHFFRSMEIARALRRQEVLFVEGGDPLPGFMPPRHVRRLILPSMMMDAEFSSVRVREGTPGEVRQRRTEMLLSAFDSFEPDVLITELFPFGRRQFRFELIPLLDAARAKSVRVVCSLRDILVEKGKPEEYESSVLAMLERYYDLVLVHSDPSLITLDETYSRVRDIPAPVEYTGYVVRRKAGGAKRRVEGKTVVASSGGGAVGADLLSAVILAFREIVDADLRLRVFIGPFMEPAVRSQLETHAAEDPRISLRPFSFDFLAELAHAPLSVSMAGYNTCMDILGAGTKALVYPFPQNREQALRAKKLQEAGLLKIIEKVAPDYLRNEMERALDGPLFPGLSPRPPRMDGAAKTAAIIEKYFGRR